MSSHNALFVLIQYMLKSSNPPMRNCLIAVNIILSRSRWATLYTKFLEFWTPPPYLHFEPIVKSCKLPH